MGLSEELIKRIFVLFKDDDKVRELVAEGDIKLLWAYVYKESNECSIPFLDSQDIVQSCEYLNFGRLGDLYFNASRRLSNKKQKPLDVDSEVRYYKWAYPKMSEDEITSYIESLKHSEIKEIAFLEEFVAAFKSLNLQGIYTKAKRDVELSTLCGELAALQKSSEEDVTR